jgi:hypothetical protein
MRLNRHSVRHGCGDPPAALAHASATNRRFEDASRAADGNVRGGVVLDGADWTPGYVRRIDHTHSVVPGSMDTLAA